MLGVCCHILRQQPQPPSFFFANCTTLQCRIGQLVQFVHRDIEVGKPDLLENWEREFLQSPRIWGPCLNIAILVVIPSPLKSLHDFIINLIKEDGMMEYWNV